MVSTKALQKWLLESGIQGSDGAVLGWLDKDFGQGDFRYSEITGYTITCFAWLYGMTGNEVWLNKAKQAATWIMEKAMTPEGGVLTREFLDQSREQSDFYSFSNGRVLAFDVGMALNGFVNLYKVTREGVYLETAQKLAGFLEQYLHQEDGSLAPVWNSATSSVETLGDKWSHQSGSYHSKVAMGLADLCIVTGQERYKNIAINIAEFSLSLQDPKTGRFVTDVNNQSTNLHPHLYAAEGLWYVGNVLECTDFMVAAKHATEWCLSLVSQTGLYEMYYRDGATSSDVRVDVLAQAVRMAYLSGLENDQSVSVLQDLLAGYQACPGAGKQAGGVFYSPKKTHLNAWVGMFALQAGMLADGTAQADREFFLV